MLLKHNFAIFFLAILICFAALIRPARADIDLDPQQVPWSQLSFHAKKFWVEVASDIQLRYLTASELDAVLLTSPQGDPLDRAPKEAAQMTIHTTIDPRFRSAVNIVNHIWFDPIDASALGRVRIRRGEDDFKKLYRFTKQGAFRHRIEPKNKDEARLAPESWTDTKDTFYPYDKKQLKCPVVSERSVLIYILSAAAVARNNNPFLFCAFGKRQLHRVSARIEGWQPVAVQYIEKGRQTENLKEGTVRALKIAITGTPVVDDQRAAENFSFLGFRKNIAIYIDPTRNLPIQISGVIPSIGKAELKLNRVRLNQTSD